MVEATASMNKPAPAAAVPGQEPNKESSDPSKTAGSIKAVSAPFQIQTMQQRQRWLKILFYGRHGAGKTELAASAVDVPSMGDVLMIDAESGASTIEDSPRIKNPDKIHTIRVTTFKQVAYIQEFLSAYCKARDAGDIGRMAALYSKVTGIPVEDLNADNLPRYRTVIIDSLTEVEVYCTYGILSIDTGKIVSEDMDVAGWPEFRKNNEMVKLLVRAFRDLPMNVIFVCAEQWTQDEQKKYHYTPQLTGKLSAQVQGFVDIVGWITVGAIGEGQYEAPRRVYVQPITGSGPKFDAKNRRPVYKQAYFDNPSMATIMKDVGLLK